MKIHGKRTDKSQAEIVRELRDAGIGVTVLTQGNGLPDLLLTYRNVATLCELKEINGSVKRGQLEFISAYRAPIGIAVSFESAFDLAMLPQLDFSPSDKDKIAAWLIQNPIAKTLAVRKLFKILGKEI